MKTQIGDINIHWQESGNPDGSPVVFAHALSSDLRIWDNLFPLLNQDLRLIRMDMRGHGQTDCPKPPYSMGALVKDAEGLLDHLKVRDCVFVGLSIGGMIAQGLAAKRLDLVRGLVLSNTAAKIATREIWKQRIADLQSLGISVYTDAILTRWFGPEAKRKIDVAPWRELIEGQNIDGVAGACHAIAGTDFYSTTASLTLPTLGIAGTHDGSTPPDLVRETVALIKGSDFAIIPSSGHIPFAENPEKYAALVNGFCARIGHD